jgi:alpha-1,6-mannosyltransferase
MIGLLAMGTLLVIERRHATGVALVTMAMAIKVSAGVALPFLVWIWAARLPGTRHTQLLRAGSGSVAIFAAIFTGITLVSGVGLGWVPALDAPSLIVNWMSLPTAAGELAHAMVTPFAHVSEHPFIVVTRLLGSAAFLAIFARQWWSARHAEPGQTVRNAARTLLWAALLAPATLPWYLSWALVLGAVGPWSRRPLAWVVAGSTWLVVCTYPTGESAFSAWLYQLGMVAVSFVAAVSLLRADPLGLRSRIPFMGPTPARLT